MYSHSPEKAAALQENRRGATSRETTRSGDPLGIVKWQPQALAAKPSRSLVNEARRLDQELREKWACIQNDVIRVGEILTEIMNRRLHVALGYANFQSYVHEACGYSKTQAFEAMRILRELTTGPGALPSSAVSRMSRENAKRVIRLKEHGVSITPQIVEAAQTMSEKQFLEDIEFPAMKTQGVAQTQSVMLSRYTLDLPKEILNQLLYAHEILKARVCDADSSQAINEQAWAMMAAEIISAFGAEYEQKRARLVESAPEKASAAAEESGPPTPEAKGAEASAAEEAQKLTKHAIRKLKKASASEAQPQASAAG